MADLTELQKKLFSLQDKKYLTFTEKIVNDPDTKIIGVRVPDLRRLAREIHKCDGKGDGGGNQSNGTALSSRAQSRDLLGTSSFLKSIPHEYHEENLLHIYLLNMEKDFGAWKAGMEEFLPYITNWAVCDNYNSVAVKKNRAKALPQILKWAKSKNPWAARYGIGLLMSHFLDEDFNVEQMELVAKIKSGHYYLNMMRAWYFATALAKQSDTAIEFIEEKKLDAWTHNKAIQKARESFRVSDEQKEYLKELKI